MSAEALLEGFLQQTVDSAELNTEFLLCPELEGVPVTVKKWDIKTGTYNDKEGVEKAYYNLTIQYIVDSEEARAELSRDEVVVYGSSVFLTVSEEGKLDLQNNQMLARTLRVFDCPVENLTNKEILDSLIGCYGVGKVTHRALSNKAGPLLDEEGNQRYSAEVSAIGKA